MRVFLHSRHCLVMRSETSKRTMTRRLFIPF
nr:MAG TPA: hypothetical protein [Caudoviricetes sp.]